MRNIFSYLVIFCFVLLFSGCVGDKVIDDPLQAPSRTILFYMGGDNNLSVETSQKLAAIQRFATTSEQVARGELNLIIYQDAVGGSKLYRARFGQSTPELVGEYGDDDSSSPAVLSRVIKDCLQLAPADNYGLLVFSHASGWLPAGTLDTPRKVPTRSVIIDNTSEMDIKDFASAIPSQTFDYVIFEACYMSCIEVAYELRNKVRYVVGAPTEMLSPGFTDVYSQLLSSLCSTQVDTPTSLNDASQVYFDHYNTKSGVNRSATVSVIRTAELERFAWLYRKIAPQLSATTVRGVQHFDRNVSGDHMFFDLEDYVSRYAPESLGELRVLLSKTVLFNASTPEFLLSEGGFSIRANCGLSIYIEQDKFPYINLEYQKLEWSKYLQK